MNIKVKNRHRLKTKEIKEIQNKLQNIFDDIFFDIKSPVETGDVDGIQTIFVNQEPCFIFHENQIIFTLHGINRFKPKRNFVIVDMGAIKFVTSGADVMAPGIVDADINIKKDDQVWICDEKNHKPLAVGIALINGDEMIKHGRGKAIKVVHHVGDKIWNFVAKSL